MTFHRDYIRSSIFGFEDSLVSTTGVVVGIATGTSNREFIVLAAFVTIAVEAISMTAGQFLSERTLHELNKTDHNDNLIVGSLVMFISYFLGGLIPLLPILILPAISILPILLLAFLGLFVLGYAKGQIVKVAPTRSAFEMLVIGGFATLIGVVSGYFLKIK